MDTNEQKFRIEGDAALVTGSIASAKVDDDRLRIEMSGGAVVELKDEGQCCCEHRFITCDDQLADIIGAQLLSIRYKEFKRTTDGEYGEEHEQVFIDVVTSAGTITLCTHNEHNGYYGGFDLVVSIS